MAANTLFPLDAVAAYERDGAVCLRGAFGAEWVDLACRGIERNIAQPGPLFRNLGGPDGGFLSDIWARRHIPEFERFCMESPAAAIAAQALHANPVRLVQDTWFSKLPGASARTPWHHDTAIAGPFCSIWVALDVTPRDAALEFVAGSHRWGATLMPSSYFDGEGNAAERFYKEFHGDAERDEQAAFGQVPDIEADRDAYDIIGWELRPGDCLLFDARTLHGAPGNHLQRPLRRFVTRWITEASVLSPHGGDVIGALAAAGLQADLAVGKPIRGPLFPLVNAAPDGRAAM
ncbi:MAG: phytanoyl-CoA dioxygenase family protein [Burkholderiaceae bacterium]